MGSFAIALIPLGCDLGPDLPPESVIRAYDAYFDLLPVLAGVGVWGKGSAF